MGDISKSLLKAEWKAYIFENYDKMTTSANILQTQHVFKVKLQDEPNMYGLYTRIVGNGSSQVQGISFDASHAPTSYFESIWFILAITDAMNMILKLHDVSTSFQQSIE
eukprot:5473045-Ditylum_brightwellii.AAC.1